MSDQDDRESIMTDAQDSISDQASTVMSHRQWSESDDETPIITEKEDRETQAIKLCLVEAKGLAKLLHFEKKCNITIHEIFLKAAVDDVEAYKGDEYNKIERKLIPLGGYSLSVATLNLIRDTDVEVLESVQGKCKLEAIQGLKKKLEKGLGGAILKQAEQQGVKRDTIYETRLEMLKKGRKILTFDKVESKGDAPE